MKGYKAFNKDLSCRDVKFEVGQTKEIKGDIELCKNGIHFCEKFESVFLYYPKSSETRICEVEAVGEVKTEGDKSATNKLKIIRELSTSEILDKVLNNSNSGNRNSGDRNSGYGNSGNRNSGYGNSGDWNSGDRNSGDGNSGNRNSGYGNSGDRNSGDWNSGDGNSGYFNTEVPVYFFNKPSDTKYTKELESKIRSLNVKPIVQWIGSSQMTEEEKAANPTHKVTEGFLRKTGRHDFRYLTDSDKEFIKSLPNFDDEIFQKISNGVSLLEDKIDVIVNGKTIKVDMKKAKELGLIE